MPSIDAFNPAASSTNTALHQGGSQQGAGTNIGQYDGQRVRVDEANSLLADAAEELSLHFAEKAETKHASQRRKETTQQREMMNIEAIEAYMERVQEHDDPDHMAKLARRVLSKIGMAPPGGGARSSNAPSGIRARGQRESGSSQGSKRGEQEDDALHEVEKAFANPTQRILALQYIIQLGEREKHPEEDLLELRDALQDLELEYADALRADINTIAVAAQGAHSSSEILQFQETYHDVVLGENTLATTLQLALERFGENDFSTGLQRLIQALGQDLAAARPSAEPARLQSLVQDLYHLSVASTVLEGCHQLLQQLGAQHAPLWGSPVELMKQMVGLSAEKWIAASCFTTLSTDFGAGDIAPQIHFLTGVKALLRDMPTKVFADADQRLTVFQAVQDALDTAIDREEGLA